MESKFDNDDGCPAMASRNGDDGAPQGDGNRGHPRVFLDGALEVALPANPGTARTPCLAKSARAVRIPVAEMAWGRQSMMTIEQKVIGVCRLALSV